MWLHCYQHRVSQGQACQAVHRDQTFYSRATLHSVFIPSQPKYIYIGEDTLSTFDFTIEFVIWYLIHNCMTMSKTRCILSETKAVSSNASVAADQDARVQKCEVWSWSCLGAGLMTTY